MPFEPGPITQANFPDPDAASTDTRVRPLRPRARRYPFIATAELVDLHSDELFLQKTSDLSLFGCLVTWDRDFLPGAKLRIRIIHSGASFHALGRVARISRQPGLGIEFTGIEDRDREVLEGWMSELRNQRS